ncbi:S-adenosyl-L-methionine-dependent methyltransferase [Butyriboletus roseoflavus]|nr:S-adenosyl-L-methionine-dependent methyltransferase [Butyriboletus roseoflavus]
MVQNRLAKLALVIGRECADQELKWMKQSRPTALLDTLDRRLAGEPLQYILGRCIFTPPPIPALTQRVLGTTPFGPLDLLTRPPTLIPRPETEDWALRLARTRTPDPTRPVRVLDLCTGSGCIPLLLCHVWPPGSTRAVGVDISPDAIRLAADNAARSRSTARARARHSSTAAPSANNLRTHAHARYRYRNTPGSENIFTPLLGDVYDPDLLHRLDTPFDVITANPPYIPLNVYRTLSSSVRDYEDPRALIGDPPNSTHQDGLSFYRTIAALIARKGVLAADAVVALEVGHGQAHVIKHMLRHTPDLSLGPIEIWKDPWDKERVVFARVA